MNEIQKAYVAGIIDGEGSIMLQSFHKNQLPSPCVSVASTSMELLIYLKQIISCGVIVKKKNYNLEKHHDSYTFYVRYNNAINLLIEIEPYLIIESKRKRAKLIIEKYKTLTPRNGRYSEEQLLLKELFYKEFINT
ncbi:LAGLIDADG family homing endonuclease [Clostridium tunisiense]|uniref:LAGLIDADG family homing endonuclease n=1 Tax=Clostridium tunisiense TaxID=219748 RepID=UPI0003091694|nr:LAGLIDADG family homing endonuclease [Clostridium tunisiense]